MLDTSEREGGDVLPGVPRVGEVEEEGGGIAGEWGEVEGEAEEMTILSFIDSLLPRDGKTRGVLLLVIGSFFGLVGPWCINGVLASFQERASFDMQLDQIELTRRIMAEVPCDERIIAFAPQMADAYTKNLRITYEHRANRKWYADPFSPDAWQAVTLIRLPCEQQEAQ